MAIVRQFTERKFWVIASAVTVLFAGYVGSVLSDEVKVTLSGHQEIPPVTTAASGTGTFTVGADKSVSGNVTISGMSATVAHIHEAAAGITGLIIIPLTKSSDNVWTVPAGAKLTDAQYESYKAGNLYYNIHSAPYKSGEIRGQIKP
jgi:CHRD domain